LYLNVTQGVIEQIQTAINTLETTAILAGGGNSMDNNVALKFDNQAGTPVEVLKMTTGNIAEFQTLPRLPSARSIAHNNDVVDKKYGDDNWGGTATGMIMIWTTDSAPAGWLLCYGQAVSRVTYATLFALIGTTFGVGDTTTTFNLPDMRGRVPLGQDDMGGASANRVTNAQADTIGGSEGEESHQLSVAELATHSHLYVTQDGNVTSSGGSYSGQNATSHTTGNAGSNTAHNNMQPYLTLNYIIKY